jgi:hypothetical protein
MWKKINEIGREDHDVADRPPAGNIVGALYHKL